MHEHGFSEHNPINMTLKYPNLKTRGYDVGATNTYGIYDFPKTLIFLTSWY